MEELAEIRKRTDEIEAVHGAMCISYSVVIVYPF